LSLITWLTLLQPKLWVSFKKETVAGRMPSVLSVRRCFF
jgi:hypothetical protein